MTPASSAANARDDIVFHFRVRSLQVLLKIMITFNLCCKANCYEIEIDDIVMRVEHGIPKIGSDSTTWAPTSKDTRRIFPKKANHCLKCHHGFIQ